MKSLLVIAIAAALSATAAAQTTSMTAEEALRDAKAKEAAAKQLAADEQAAAAKKAARAAERKRRQEMVSGTTGAATTQFSAAPNRTFPQNMPAESAKLTPEQRKDVMQGASQSAGSQYGPSAGVAATKVDKNAPKAAKPDMSDPKVEAAMQKASKQ